MSNGRMEYSERGRSDVKYSEIVTMSEIENRKNGLNSKTEEDQNQNPIDNSSNCPLPTTVLLSNRGIPTIKAMEYRDDEVLDFEISASKTQKYRKRAVILGGIACIMTIATIILAVLLGTKNAGTTVTNNAWMEGADFSPISGFPNVPERTRVLILPLSDTPSEMCTSPACISAASRIINSMDRTVNPCDDFYTYSCGKWNRDHLIPEDRSSVSTFNDVRDSVSQSLKRVLEEDMTEDRNSIKKAKTLYASCMDTAKIDAVGGQPALKIVEDVGGMPLFGDPLTGFNLEDALGRSVAKYGTHAIISTWVTLDDKNSTVNILKLSEPALGMPNRDYYLDIKRNLTLPGYTEFMQNFLSALWKEKDNSKHNISAIKEVSDKIIEIETDLATIMMKPEDRRDSFSLYKKRSIQAMSNNLTDDFNWLRFVNKCFSYIGKKLEPSTMVVSYGDQYFGNFTKVLSKYSAVDLQNYIVWMIIRARVGYLGKYYRDTQAPYRQAVSGTSLEKERWLTCSDNANSHFLMPVGAMFVKAKFTEKNKNVTDTMVENLRKAFIGFLPENDWMDDKTKTEAEKKANQISPIIAYPEYALDTENPKMDDDYEKVIVSMGQYFLNIQNLTFFSTQVNMERLDKLVDREEWITGPAVVNAYYSPVRNQIVFPAGILQPPFYDEGQPNSMNYGGIGMVIGHEITHGFDNSGSRYNGIGNLENWWSNHSRENFELKAKCVEDQYSGYYWEEAGGNLNGKLTLGENIADNGGIRQAYDAYQAWKLGNETDLLLPGLQNFTQEQLFFLSMSQVWCGLYRPEYARRLVASDGHSPGIYRVIGSISNFEEFGKAYNCKKGTDRMYPNEENTCRVW